MLYLFLSRGISLLNHNVWLQREETICTRWLALALPDRGLDREPDRQAAHSGRMCTALKRIIDWAKFSTARAEGRSLTNRHSRRWLWALTPNHPNSTMVSTFHHHRHVCRFELNTHSSVSCSPYERSRFGICFFFFPSLWLWFSLILPQHAGILFLLQRSLSLSLSVFGVGFCNVFPLNWALIECCQFLNFPSRVMFPLVRSSFMLLLALWRMLSVDDGLNQGRFVWFGFFFLSGTS